MAEGFLKSLDPALEVHSAGTHPASAVNPHAVAVMKEIGCDISRALPRSVEEFIRQPFDYVITVCDDAREACPVFTGRVSHRLHIGFEDPAKATGTEEEILSVYRRTRDHITAAFHRLYTSTLIKTTQ